MSLVIEITQTTPVITEPVVTLLEVEGAGPQGATGVIAATPPITYDAQTKTLGFNGALSDLSDVDTDGAVQHDLLAYDGTEWKPTDTPTVRGLQLDTASPQTLAEGMIVWNNGDRVPQFRSNGITVDLSLEMLARCRNVTGSPILKGTAVCIVGASAQRISIAPSDRTQPGSACRTLGITLENIANNGFGKVSTFGLVRGLDTSQIDGEEGDELFVGPTPGSLSTVEPEAPARRLSVGFLVTKNSSIGKIFVRVSRGVRVPEIDDVQIASLADRDILQYVASRNRWENAQIVVTVERRYDFSTATHYAGTAPDGSAESDPVWTITRFTFEPFVTATATGVAWDERTTAIYS
jgi:hypothetical protein